MGIKRNHILNNERCIEIPFSELYLWKFRIIGTNGSFISFFLRSQIIFNFTTSCLKKIIDEINDA